jgi:UDP-N-acetylmuramoyl-L-alanyl-D-glutamate--2,6-diaminopimelate ligase
MTRPFTPFSMTLAQAVSVIGSANELDRHDASVTFTGITHKDSDVQPGDLFLAFPGARTHGAKYAQSAQSKGAVAVLTDSIGASMISGMPVITIENVRVAGASLASTFYRQPLRSMESVGITGTNGKTTVTTLLYQIMTLIERESGLIGTVETRIGSDVIDSERTTPEAADLQALAATMVERHMRHCFMEVSSHSLDLKRMVGSHFAAVGFTNLTQDHLDYHHDMESYFKAKSQLFTFEYADQGFVNIDTEYGVRLADISEIPVLTVSRFKTDAVWHYVEATPTIGGAEFIIRGRDGVLIESSTRLHGAFNLDNLLMAIAIAYHLGADPLQLADIAPKLTGATGRLQSIALGQGFKALVDYAHSPDSVSQVLAAVKEMTEGKVIAVLGCGGDRDNSKRPLMGRALLEGADIAIYTSDNPRSEDPHTIVQQMTSGLTIESPSNILEDRREAIAYAVACAMPGDSVVVLGKGHENGQEIKGVIHPFDDVLEVAAAIEALR